MMQILIILFFTPAIAFLICLFWVNCAVILNEAIRDKKIKKYQPHCSIDPLDHPSFRWGDDGNGYIEGMMVIKK